MGMFLATIVGRCFFLTATLAFLMVGHTHEDVDQLFGLILMLVIRRYNFEIAEDLATRLEVTLKARCAAKNEDLVVELLQEIRDFRVWLADEGVQLHNAWMSRRDSEGNMVTAPHAFSYKRRPQLTRSEKESVSEAPRFPASDDDVFCIVKRHMRDTEPQHEPVLVLPSARLARVGPPAPTTIVPRRGQDENKLLEIAAILGAEPYGYYRAATALRQLAAPYQATVPPAGWLGLPPQLLRPAAHGTDNPYFPDLPQTSWKLLAKFHSR